MLDNIKPFELKFIQRIPPRVGDDFEYAYIYSFWTDECNGIRGVKYVLRAEKFEDTFAIKFYAQKDSGSVHKYHKILQLHDYKSALRVFVTCASVVPVILENHPDASFVVMGAQSIDEIGNMEQMDTDQRFRIYRYIATRLFGRVLFEHYEYTQASTYLLLNKTDCDDVNQKQERIKNMFSLIYDID